MIIGSISHIPYGTFVASLAPVAAVGLILTAILIAVAFPSEFFTRQPLRGYSGQTWTMISLMALGPQLLGHSLLNWALRYLSAPAVSIAILGEPVISTALAAPILGEPPGIVRIVGGAIILAGVYVALRDESSRAGAGAAEVTAVVSGMSGGALTGES